MSFAFDIARRYLVSKKSTNAINIISGVSVLAIGIITAAMVIGLSVFNGFEHLVISLYNSFYPDMMITVKEGKSFTPDTQKLRSIEELAGIDAFSLVVEENALLKYGDQQYLATIKGVDPQYRKVTGVDSMLVRGDFLLTDQGIDHAVIGAGVEANLGVNLGDEFSGIQVFLPKRGSKTVLRPDQAFNRKTIYPKGVFAIQQEFDLKYMLTPIGFARSLLNYTDEVTAIELKLGSDADHDRIQEQLQAIMGPGFHVKNRYEQNEFLYKIMRMEKWAMFLILFFILFIAAFNIIGSLSMLVIEKKKDIAILKTMGATKALVTKIFLLQSMMMALIGTGSGFLLGAGICFAQQTLELIKLQGTGTFVITAYPVKMEVFDFMLILLTVILIVMLAAWYPSKRAGEQLTFVREA